MGAKHTTTLAVCLLLTAPMIGLAANATQPEWTWSEPALLEFDDTGDAVIPHVAASDDGTAIAVWIQQTDTFGVMLPFASHFDPASGWSSPVVLAANRSSNASLPAVAMDRDGNGIIAWDQGGVAGTDIWAVFYSAGSGFSPASLIDTTDTETALEPAVAIRASGTGVVVWEQFDTPSLEYRIWARTLVPSFWFPPQQIEYGSGSCFSPQVAMDLSGDVVVVYTCEVDLDFVANTVTFDVVAQSWLSYIPFSGSTGHLVGLPDLSMDSTGNATAIWAQEKSAGSFNTDIYSAKFTAGFMNDTSGVYFVGSWALPTTVDSSTSRKTEPVVAMDGAGRAYAAYTQVGTPDQIWMNDQSATGSWGTPTQWTSAPSRYSQHPRIAVNSAGFGVVAYAEDGYKKAGVLEPYTGWNCCTYIDHHTPPTLAAMDVAVDAAGNAFVVMGVTDDTVQNIHAVRYAAHAGHSPSLEVLDPAGYYTETDRPFITITGTSDPLAAIDAGGSHASASVTGAFSVVVPLYPGNNIIQVRASDAFGDFVELQLEVQFNDPLPALQSNLTAAEAQVDALNAQLADTNAQLVTAQQAVDAAQAQLAVVEGTATATALDLSIAQQDLASAQADLSNLQGQQATLQSMIDDAQSNVDIQAQALAAAQAQVAALTASLAATSAALNSTSASLQSTNASLASANGRIDALENAGGGPTQADVDAANSAASTAMLVGLLGIIIGGAAVGTSFMMGRRGGGGSGGSGGMQRTSQQAQAAARPAGDKGGGGSAEPDGGGGPAEHDG